MDDAGFGISGADGGVLGHEMLSIAYQSFEKSDPLIPFRISGTRRGSWETFLDEGFVESLLSRVRDNLSVHLLQYDSERDEREKKLGSWWSLSSPWYGSIIGSDRIDCRRVSIRSRETHFFEYWRANIGRPMDGLKLES